MNKDELRLIILGNAILNKTDDSGRNIAIIDVLDLTNDLFALCEVSRSLPTDKEIIIEADKKSNYRYNELNDDLSKKEKEGFISGAGWLKRKIIDNGN